ncbi:hypothetical protein WN944_001058 [Citrus x changshan-huyou]|uniref:Uncharacterized protein n=1 Tax=Citrus x changshan-huyou TaxID=2935761 RepID=A0AAP0MGK7_9ROSI
MCNDEFRDKSPEDALDYVDYIAENAQHWDTIGFYESLSKTQPSPSSGGIYNLKEDHDLQAKFTFLARKVEALESKKNNHVPIGDNSNFEDTKQPEEPNKKEAPELEFKPLSEELKYAYLREQQTYPVRENYTLYMEEMTGGYQNLSQKLSSFEEDKC